MCLHMTEKFFKKPAFISEIVHIFHKNWGYIYLNDLSFSQVSFNCYTPGEDDGNDVTNTGQLIFIHVLGAQQKLASLYNSNGITTAKICS